MIREPSADPAERVRALAEIRDSLRAFETSELAGVAAHLAETTERLLEASRKLSRPLSDDWYTAERAAREMGYVNPETDEIRKDAFLRAMKAAGVPRAELSQTRIYYHREDLDKMLRGLRQPGV